MELPFVANAASDAGKSSGGGTGFPSLAETAAARRDTTETNCSLHDGSLRLQTNKGTNLQVLQKEKRDEK